MNNYTDIDLEKAKDRELKEAKRRYKDTMNIHGAQPHIPDSSNIDTAQFTASLDSMTRVINEPGGVMRYSRMSVIEFEPTVMELKAKIKLLRAKKKLNNTIERLSKGING